MTRYSGPDSEWEDWETDWAGPAFEIFRRACKIAETVELYVPGKAMSLDISSPMAIRMMNTVDTDIAEAVRGYHWPHNLDARIDPHDIIETLESERGRRIARAFFSVKFWGENIPPRFPEYRRQVMELPLVGEIRDELSRIVGTRVECGVFGFL